MTGTPERITTKSRLGHFLSYAPSGTIYWCFDTYGPDIIVDWNNGCKDVSKTKVHRVHSQVFGYSAKISPENYGRPYVEKSDLQAKHDGKVLTEPKKPLQGKVYEQLIIPPTNGIYYSEYRVFVFNEVRFVIEKNKQITDPFGWRADKALYHEPLEVFTPDELRQINKFCRVFDVQLCELDIMRDINEGLIYILDVNNMAGGTDNLALFMMCQNKNYNYLYSRYAHALADLY